MDARAAVNFKITDLAAELDETASSSDKQGVLNYSQRRRSAEFHQGLRFPEIASTLETLGLDPELQRPVKAALHSEGEILDDQSLAPSGRCDFGPVRYFLMKKQSMRLAMTVTARCGLGVGERDSRKRSLPVRTCRLFRLNSNAIWIQKENQSIQMRQGP